VFFTPYETDESSEVRYEVLPLLKVPVLCDDVLCHWVNTKVLLKVMRLISQSSKHVTKKMPSVLQICKTVFTSLQNSNTYPHICHHSISLKILLQ
jgi:hypothetical protein